MGYTSPISTVTVITIGKGYDRSGMSVGKSPVNRLKPPNLHKQLDSSPVPMFSKRNWFHDLLLSSHSVLCSPFSDHVMPVTVRSVVHASRFELRAFSVNCAGWYLVWSQQRNASTLEIHSRRSLLKEIVQ